MDDITTLNPDSVAALERASHALGRLEMLVESQPPSVAEALIRRQALRMAAAGPEGAVALLLHAQGAKHRNLLDLHAVLSSRPAPPLQFEDLIHALRAAGAEPPDSARRRLEEAVLELQRSALVRASSAFGAIVSSAPATREALCSAALAADLLLAAGGLAVHSRVSPIQLDAATRSAAVQIERAAGWTEWIKAWSHLIAREAAATERAVRTLGETHARNIAVAGGQHRVGATDAQVLTYLQGVSSFSIPNAVRHLGLSAPTVGTSIERLDTAGVATELTGQKRDRIWVSTAALELISGG